MSSSSHPSVMPPLPPQDRVLGVPIHVLSDYSGWLAERINHRQGTHVITLNAEMVMQSRTNSILSDSLGQAELIVPDGSGVVLYLRSRGQMVQRCPGIELAEKMIHLAAQRGWRVFLLGGAPGIANQIINQWEETLPQLVLAGAHHGYFDDIAEVEICKHLSSMQPELILVGLGVPRQEAWIQSHRHLCPNSVWIGVGGSLDIWSGNKERAPIWLRDNHLEWIYRLYKEPWRWRRMMALPHFVWAAFWEKFFPVKPLHK
ncbi:MAG: WecB/TagA/CpsF family glycosyltransferase [Pseudanabaenaceae cyanobacterium]